MFDPIVVVPTVDEYGSDASGEAYLSIIIVFDGDQKQLLNPFEPLSILRDQWCAEPSVHGGKSTRIDV